jgi:ABC-type glycerol-3-phosphate transport system substrate-binding protein
MTRVIAGLVLVASLAAAGCGGSPTSKPADSSSPPPFPEQKDKGGKKIDTPPPG